MTSVFNKSCKTREFECFEPLADPLTCRGGQSGPRQFLNIYVMKTFSYCNSLIFLPLGGVFSADPQTYTTEKKCLFDGKIWVFPDIHNLQKILANCIKIQICKNWLNYGQSWLF